MIADLDVAVANMDEAATDFFDLLMDEDASELIAETRVMIDEATRVIRQISTLPAKPTCR